MSKLNLFFISTLALMILFLSFFFIQNFRIDASSDTLVAQNDEDFKYYNNYNKLFKSDNFLIIAVEKKGKLDKEFINNFDSISSKLLNLDEVKQVFSFIDAPILFLNNTKLTNLSGDNIDNLRNSNLELKKVIEEFTNNPVYINQIINKEANVFSIIIYLKKKFTIN